MRSRIIAIIAPIALLLLLSAKSLGAQARPSLLKNEIGLGIGVVSPFPQTELEQVLRTNIGLGAMYRYYWHTPFFAELGFSWSYHDSRTEQSLIYFPLFLALGYKYSLRPRLALLFKAGGGGANLQIRPANKSGWEPLIYSGIELSILATTRLRVGVRLDYNYIYEEALDPPPEIEEAPPLPSGADSRFARAQGFEMINGQFFHFTLVVSLAY